MSGENRTSRLSVARAAFVVARRDFTAILFSKAFFFFLIGPLIFVGISGAAGYIGASAADSGPPPGLGIVMSPADNAAMVRAHESLEDLIDLPPVEAVSGGEATDIPALLADKDRNLAAVVSGSLSAPALHGTEDRIDRWKGDVSLLAATARGDTASYPEVTLFPAATSRASERSARAGTATAAITLLFLLTMLLAGMVMSNMVEEKANKIVEILAAAVPMDAVFLGKLFAMLAVSFVGIAVWGSVAGVILVLGASAIPPLPAPAIGWPLFATLFLLYFAMAYLLIGSVFLAIGAMAPTVRDVQTMSMPATMLQLGVFFLATFAVSSTGSPIELAAIAFPLSSPYVMLARAAQEPVVWWHFAALGWQVLWVVLFVKFGATLFRRKVLKSGGAGRAKTKSTGLLAGIAGLVSSRRN